MDLRVINILRLGVDAGILYHCERPIQQSNFSILRRARLLRNIVELLGGAECLPVTPGAKTKMESPMCDFSLQSVRSRPAKVGDKLVTRDFGTGTLGFADVDDLGMAVWG